RRPSRRAWIPPGWSPLLPPGAISRTWTPRCPPSSRRVRSRTKALLPDGEGCGLFWAAENKETPRGRPPGHVHSTVCPRLGYSSLCVPATPDPEDVFDALDAPDVESEPGGRGVPKMLISSADRDT